MSWRPRGKSVFQVLHVFLIVWLIVVPTAWASDSNRLPTALDRYVLADDPAFRYEVLSDSVSAGLYSVTTLRVYSQQWQDTTWSHLITIYNPLFSRREGPVTIFVDGGSKPSKDLESLSAIAIVTQTPVVILGSVPNQPIYDRREDALIAYTFVKYLETADETWPLLFPMTKSVVACMDALDSYFASKGRFTPTGYVITGASKRGWTTWLTAAVDPRVIGIIPLVYDNLNLKAQMDNQLAVWGEYSPQIHDYTDLDIQRALETEAGVYLAEMVDPYFYLDRMHMPKLIVIGSNDPYWPLGSVNLYYDRLRGDDNYLLIMPNTGHEAGDMDRLLSSVVAFLRHVSGLGKLPKLSWSFAVDEETKVVRAVVHAPEDATVQLWQASSATTDFRGSKWTLIGEPVQGPVAEFELPLPESGKEAIFADITIRLLGARATFTTTPFIY